MTDVDGEDQDVRTVKALADAERITLQPCRTCAASLCGHDAVFALVLGYKSAPRCLPCIASHMQEPVADLRERALDYVRHHECFLAAWRRAGELEGFGAVDRPSCQWGEEIEASLARDPSAPEVPGTHESPSPTVLPTVTWDAGDRACGDLVLDLRLRLRDLPSGGVLHLRATDAGAPIDLPAWCAMTGHTLVEAEHPNYRIRRRQSGAATAPCPCARARRRACRRRRSCAATR